MQHAEQSSINSVNHVTYATKRRHTRISARPYVDRSACDNISLTDGLHQWHWVTACKKNDFWRCMSFFSPDIKVHMVVWWHRKSDCMPWCQPSTELVLRAMPSTPVLNAMPRSPYQLLASFHQRTCAPELSLRCRCACDPVVSIAGRHQPCFAFHSLI